MKMLSTLIGHVEITEPYETTQHYEYAAYYTVHTVQPGTYPVYCLSKYPEVQGNNPFAYYLSVTFDTVIMRTDREHDKHVGERSTHTIRPYAYQCPPAESLNSGQPCDFLGGTFTPIADMQFEPCIAINDGKRYGTRPVITRAHLPSGWTDEHLPKR